MIESTTVFFVEADAEDLALAELGHSPAALTFLADAVVAAHVAADAGAPLADTISSVGSVPFALVTAHATAAIADGVVGDDNALVVTVSAAGALAPGASVTLSDDREVVAVDASNTSAPGAKVIIDGLVRCTVASGASDAIAVSASAVALAA